MSLMAIPTSAFELLQVAPKLVDGALFRPPDKVSKSPNIGGDIARQHDQVLARLRELT